MLPPITKPTLLVNESITRKNIKVMAEKAAANQAKLRPHFKTHQSAAVGEWFLDAGISRCTVSSVDMARYFVTAGWKDITIAFPYNPLEASEIEKMAQEIRLNVLITSALSLEHLNRHVDAPLGYFFKVDVGTHRTGVLPSAHEEIKMIASSTNEKHQLVGLLAHAGHSYQPLDPHKANDLFDKSMKDMLSVRNTIGIPNLPISWGDTPTCSLLSEFPEVNELRPGNFAFYDVMQHHFNACQLEDIAVCLACPVVSVHPDRNEAVVFGGAVHLSKDYITDSQGRNFGLVVNLTETGWESNPVARMDRLSQEHGVLKGPQKFINSLSPGDLVGILPVHSCLAADLQGYYLSLSGEKLDKLNRSV